MIVTQNDIATTFYNEDEKVLVSVYKGRAVISIIHDHLANIVEFYKKNEVLGSVVDLRGVHGSFAKFFGYM